MAVIAWDQELFPKNRFATNMKKGLQSGVNCNFRPGLAGKVQGKKLRSWERFTGHVAAQTAAYGSLYKINLLVKTSTCPRGSDTDVSNVSDLSLKHMSSWQAFTRLGRSFIAVAKGLKACKSCRSTQVGVGCHSLSVNALVLSAAGQALRQSDMSAP